MAVLLNQGDNHGKEKKKTELDKEKKFILLLPLRRNSSGLMNWEIETFKIRKWYQNMANLLQETSSSGIHKRNIIDGRG